MIKVMVKKHAGMTCGITVTGHALFDDKGRDIVCAAVSSAMQLTCNTITDFMNLPADVNTGDDWIGLNISGLTVDEMSKALPVVESLINHLQFISEDYPGTIKISITEV